MFDPKYLSHIFREHRFTFQGLELSAEDVLAERGFLPIIAYHADQNAKWLFSGLGIGVDVIEDEDTLLGNRVHFIDSLQGGAPDSLRAPLLLQSTLDVLGIGLKPQLDLVTSQPVPTSLDPLFERLAKGEPICGPI